MGLKALSNTGGGVAEDLAAHEAAANPHPGYLTPAEGDAAYQPLSSNLTGFAGVNPTVAGLALLDDADNSAQRTTLGLGTIATQNKLDPLELGPSQSELDAPLTDYFVPSQLQTVVLDGSGISVGVTTAVQNSDPDAYAQAFWGAASGTNIYGFQTDCYVTEDDGFVSNGYFYSVIAAGIDALHIKAVTLASSINDGATLSDGVYGLCILTPSFGAGASAPVNYGVFIEDQTGAASNWAIKTGLGKVEFGDAVFAAAINGGTAANDDITIQGTTHATRGDSYVNLQPNGGNVAIGATDGISQFDLVIPSAKTTAATTIAAFIRTNDTPSPFALRVRITGAAGAVANRSVDFQTTDYNSADGGTLGLQQAGGNVGIGLPAASVAARLHVAKDGQLYNNSSSWGFICSDATTPAKLCSFGYDSNSDVGYLSATHTGVANKNLVLQGTGGNIGAGDGMVAPTARVHITAGTATANTAPLKFNSGTLLSAPEAGAEEFLTDDRYATVTTGAARKTYAWIPAQTNVTASRALDTTYTAPATRSIMVMATVRCTTTLAAGNAYAQGKSDSSTPPTTVASGKVGIEAGLLGEDNSFQISFVVAAGMKYRIDSAATNGTVTKGLWFEVAY